MKEIIKKNKALVLIIVVCLLFTTTVAGTIRFKDPSGSVYGYFGSDNLIVNNNGKVWIATGDNLQSALYDLNDSDSGLVKSPSGIEYTITDTLYIPINVTLDLKGSILKPDSDIDVVELEKNSCIKNGIINVEGLSFSKSCILLDGENKYAMISYDWYRSTEIIDMDMVSDGSGFGVNFSIDGSGQPIGACHIINCFTNMFDVAYNMNNSDIEEGDGTCWINVNKFTSCYDRKSVSMFNMDRNESIISDSENSISQNMIEDCFWDAGGTISGGIGIYCEGNNNLISFHGMDVTGSEIFVNLTEDSANNQLMVTGGNALLYDTGEGNLVFHQSGGTTKISTDTRIEFFKYAQTQGEKPQQIEIYGNGGEDYAKVYVSNQGHLILDSDNDVTKIEDILFLKPRATEPGGIEGQIYYDSVFNKLRLRNNAGWVNITVS